MVKYSLHGGPGAIELKTECHEDQGNTRSMAYRVIPPGGVQLKH